MGGAREERERRIGLGGGISGMEAGIGEKTSLWFFWVRIPVCGLEYLHPVVSDFEELT